MIVPFAQRMKNLFTSGSFFESLSGMLQFGADPLGSMIRLHDELDPKPFKMAGKTLFYLRDPADVDWVLRQRSDKMTKDQFLNDLGRVLGNGLLVSEGDFWRRQRGLMAHAFTPRRIKSYGGDIATIAESFANRLRDGEVVDIHGAMNRVTLEIVAKTLFDADVSSKGGEVGHAIESIMNFYANTPEAVFGIPDWFPSKRMRAFVSARKSVQSIIESVIRERRADSNRDHGDLLGAMLDAAEADGTRMSDEQLRDELLTLFVAGHETTSLLLAHAFILLARHPDKLAKLQEEASRVLGGRAPTEADVSSLVYADQVLSEALRIFPSAWALGREAAVDVVIGKHHVPRGTQLVMSPWAMHRDTRFFVNPEAFLPERWTTEFKRQLPRGVFVPFGDGPRVCIGQHFAMLEAVLILVAIVQRVDLEIVPGESLVFAPSVTLRTTHGVSMRVRAREVRRQPVLSLMN